MDPFIKTEETIFHNLETKIPYADDDVTLCKLPLAHMINTIGIGETQIIIDSIDVKGKKLFVCQHILVSHLRFDKDSIVCTPHATIGSNYISIPHYPVNVDTSLMRKNREFQFSFMGSITTHQTRKGLTVLYPKNCFDTKEHWGLDNDLQKKEEFKKQYIDLLGNSKFSLCPRGTGISSVRLFESMAMGSIPVIIADNYKMPGMEFLNWNEIAVFCKERMISKIGNILTNNYSDERINEMREKLKIAYDKYFCPENMHSTIIPHIFHPSSLQMPS